MIEVIKTQDVDYADIGDLIIYRIEIINSGTQAITSLKLTDKLPTEVLFTANSVFEDGSLKGNANPNNGINLANLGAGQTKIVEFQAAIKDFFPFKNIENDSSLAYKLDGVNTVTNSNISTVTLTKAWLNIQKQGDAVAPLEGVVNYTIIVENVGNTKGTNLLVRDLLPEKLELLEDSILVNGEINTSTLPEKIRIGDIESGETKRIEFKAIGKNLEVNERLENVSDCFYTYTTSPDDVDGSYGTFYSNFTTTRILNAGILLEKNIVPDSIVSGSIGNCVITARNIGNSIVNNIIVTDIFPDLLSFVQGSLNIDGSESSGDISEGVNIGNLAAGEVRTIEFQFNTVDSDTTTITYNKAKADYVYDTNRNGETYTDGVEVTLLENPHKVSIEKTVSPIEINSGENAVYTIVIKNEDVKSVSDLYFVDTIPEPLTFVENTLKINGVDSSENPEEGIILGDLEGNGAYTVTFEVRAPLIETTTISTNIGEALFKDSNNNNRSISSEGTPLEIVGVPIDVNLEVVETANKTIARDGDEVIYETTITNNGDVDIRDLIYSVDIGPDQIFKEGSVVINGVEYPLENIVNGVTLPDLQVGKSINIKYTTTIQAPLDDIVNKNQYTLDYTYGIENNRGEKEGEGASLFIKGTSSPINEVEIIKTSDKSFAGLNDKITYTIEIKNTGAIDLENITFIDTIAEGTVLVEDTLKLDGVLIEGDIEEGINIGDLLVDEIKSIEFQVEVVGIE